MIGRLNTMKTATCLILFSVLILTAFYRKGEEVTVMVDTQRTYQEIHGFGASDAWRCQFIGKNWPLEKRERIADLLFSREVDAQGNPKGIGLSIWRFYIGAGSAEQGDSSGIRNPWRRAECFQHPNGTYDWNKQEGQRWFLHAAKKRGVDRFLAFTISAPVHMTLNGKAFHGSDRHNMNIIPEKLPDYADFLVEVVDHFEKEEKIRFDYLSPINEPQWLWEKATQEGTPATNVDMYNFTRLLSERLSRRGLATEVLLGEAGSIQYLYSAVDNHGNDRQIKTFFGKNSPLNIVGLPNVRRAISGHSYFTTWPVEKLVRHRRALRDTILAVDPSLEYWQTEFCILERNDDVGGGGRRDLGMKTALYYARVIHHDLVLAHANSWQFWTAVSNADYKDGLVYIDNGNNGIANYNHPDTKALQYDGHVRESKTLWAFGNYSRFVTPGMKRIHVEIQDETARGDLMISGYKDEKTGKLALVAVNTSSSEQIIKLDLAKRMTKKRLDMYTTSAEHNLAYSESDANRVKIPARSVITLVGELKNNK